MLYPSIWLTNVNNYGVVANNMRGPVDSAKPRANLQAVQRRRITNLYPRLRPVGDIERYRNIGTGTRSD